MEQVKKCSRCKTEKLLSEFHRQSRTPSGYRSHCKQCIKQYSIDNIDKIRIRQSQYYYRIKNNPEVIIKKRKYRERWRLKNPLKDIASKKKYVEKYVRIEQRKYLDYKSGLSCSICGFSHAACMEFHHPDPSQKDFNIGKGFKKFEERLVEI